LNKTIKTIKNIKKMCFSFKEKFQNDVDSNVQIRTEAFTVG